MKLELLVAKPSSINEPRGTTSSSIKVVVLLKLLLVATSMHASGAFTSNVPVDTSLFNSRATTSQHCNEYGTKHNIAFTTCGPSLKLCTRLLPSTSRLHKSQSLFMVTTGRRGKPARSKADDLEKTIAIIMHHAKRNKVVNNNKRATVKSENSSTSSRFSVANVLSDLTTCFPLFVLSSAIIGSKNPDLLTWVNKGAIIPLMLGAVMIFMGMTLTTQDFKNVFKPAEKSLIASSSSDESQSESSSSISAVPIGVLCQYLIMPLTAYTIGSIFLLPSQTAAFLGLILVGCSPGGTASNLVSLIAKADVALSVILTTASTLLASIITPLLVKTLVGSTIAVSGKVLCKATAQVILGPIILGMGVRKVLPKLAYQVSMFAPFAGVVLVSLLCGGVVAQNASIFLAGGTNSFVIKRIVMSVLALHTIGFGVGYLVPKKLFSLSERTARTISIETGMQNSALAVVLAKSVVLAMDASNTALMSLAMLPGAMSATAHSCLGSALAVYWRLVDGRDNKDQHQRSNTTSNAQHQIEGTNIINECEGSGI